MENKLGSRDKGTRVGGVRTCHLSSNDSDGEDDEIKRRSRAGQQDRRLGP